MLVAFLSYRWSGLTFGILHGVFPRIVLAWVQMQANKDIQCGEVLFRKTIVLIAPLVQVQATIIGTILPA